MSATPEVSQGELPWEIVDAEWEVEQFIDRHAAAEPGGRPTRLVRVVRLPKGAGFRVSVEPLPEIFRSITC